MEFIQLISGMACIHEYALQRFMILPAWPIQDASSLIFPPVTLIQTLYMAGLTEYQQSRRSTTLSLVIPMCWNSGQAAKATGMVFLNGGYLQLILALAIHFLGANLPAQALSERGTL